MAFLAHKQRAATALTSRRSQQYPFLIPSRAGQIAPPALQPSVWIPLNEGSGDTVAVHILGASSSVEQLTLQGHTAAAWTDRPGWYTPNGDTWGDLHDIPAVRALMSPGPGLRTLLGTELIFDDTASDEFREYSILSYDNVFSAGGGFAMNAAANTADRIQHQVRLRYPGSASATSKALPSWAPEYTGRSLFSWCVFNWDNTYRHAVGGSENMSNAGGFGSLVVTGTQDFVDPYTTLKLFADSSNLNRFNQFTSGAVRPKFSVRGVILTTLDGDGKIPAADATIRAGWDL